MILSVKAANQSCKTCRTSPKTNEKTHFVNQTINHRKNNFLLKMKFIDPFLWNAASNLNRTVSFFAAIIFADQRGSCVSDDKVYVNELSMTTSFGISVVGRLIFFTANSVLIMANTTSKQIL